MGLGTDRSEWDDYEWVDLSAEPSVEPSVEPYVEAVLAWLRDDPLWLPGPATRVLLVDLDNLRVEPVRLRSRLAMAIALAREAGHAAFAGQVGSVRRALPSLAEFAGAALAVGDGSNAADHALLEAAAAVEDDDVQFVVVSNDGIFARLAMRGPLTVLSPGSDALSDRLAEAAERVVDMTVIESGAAAG